MRLFEEYAKRHKLEFPLVKYEEKSTVVFRSKKKPRLHMILSIHWEAEDWHPGEFTIMCREPKHNGVLRPR